MKINLNSKIKVKLNEKGENILFKYWEDKFKKSNFKKEEVTEWVKSKIKNGYYETELWQFANIFGEHFYTGADPISEDNCIEIDIHERRNIDEN